MILCICSSFWPAKPQKQKKRRRAPPKNRRSEM
jgi:hypothetical protein